MPVTAPRSYLRRLLFPLTWQALPSIHTPTVAQSLRQIGSLLLFPDQRPGQQWEAKSPLRERGIKGAQADMFGILKVYVSFLTPKLPGRTTQEGGWGRSTNAVKLTRPVCLFMHRMREVATWPLWP